eukprot:scaffold9410_cov129-Skeletonema_dohrnii-CCMP3373.AAC.1
MRCSTAKGHPLEFSTPLDVNDVRTIYQQIAPFMRITSLQPTFSRPFRRIIIAWHHYRDVDRFSGVVGELWSHRWTYPVDCVSPGNKSRPTVV